jgi:hypothetical protein
MSASAWVLFVDGELNAVNGLRWMLDATRSESAPDR